MKPTCDWHAWQTFELSDLGVCIVVRFSHVDSLLHNVPTLPVTCLNSVQQLFSSIPTIYSNSNNFERPLCSLAIFQSFVIQKTYSLGLI